MGGRSALDAYESFAPIYDAFNYRNDYEMWLGRALLPELDRHGLERGQVLDVGCGTGRAFAPLLQRGWRIHGCDLSPSMLARAEQEGGDRVELDVADMRALPIYGEFELVLSLNDSVNYLLGDQDLQLALSGMRANLAGGGLLLFDVNSRATYEEGAWAGGSSTVEHEGRRWTWHAIGEVAPSTFEVHIEGDDLETVIHRHRYRSLSEVREAMAACGLECRAALGMEEIDGEVALSEPPDESRHYKVVYIAAKGLSAETGERR